MIGVVVGRITSVVVMMAVGVVSGVQRVHAVEITWRIATRRRRKDRMVSIIVEAIGRRTVINAWTRTDVDDHPRLVVITVPAETNRLEVFEDGEAVELVT